MKKIVACLFLCGLATGIFAQTVSTEILGLVTDPTGAAIPKAEVTATRVVTGEVRRTHTNETGNYVFPLLNTGEYNIRCTAAGFKASVRQGVILELQDKARIDFPMVIGEQTEIVQVEGLPAVLHTEDAVIGSVIEPQRMVGLPLNGRNFSQLATLTPGVVFGLSRVGFNGQGTLSDLAPPGQMVGISANGQRDANQHITMDGVVAVDPLHSAMLYVPSVEALEEFKVQSAVYSAEYGMNSGAQVNLSIKSGTNMFHGTVFEFLRNNVFDARGFFLAPTQPKNALHRNQFGTVVSGPVRRNRTFWLFSWESSRERRATPASAAVATMAMRSGDMSELLQPRNRWYPTDANPAATRAIRYPGTNTPFPNNIIPKSLINPASINLLTWNKDTPLPEGGFLRQPNYDAQAFAQRSTLNLVGTDGQKIDTNQYLGRFDHNFNDKHHVFARYVIVPAAWDRIPLAVISQQSSEYRSQNLGVGYTWIVSSSILNDFRFGIDRTRQSSLGIHTGTKFTQRDLGVDFRVTVDGNRTLTPLEEGIPNVNITGYTGMVEGRPAFALKGVYEYSDNLTVNRGKHNFKFGGLYRNNYANGQSANFARGVLNFTQDIVGVPDAFAAYLLGFPTSTNTADGLPPYASNVQNKWGFYALDDWKATSKLTINIGVRWDIFGVINSRQGKLRNLSFEPQFMKTINGIKVPTLIPDPNVRYNFYDINLKQIMPRLGIAYRFSNSTVLRVGGGQFYNAQQMNNITILNLAPPFSGSPSFDNDRNNPTATIQNPLAGSQQTPAQALVVLGDQQADRGNRPLFYNNYVFQWSAELEQSIARTVMASVGYVGSVGRHMDMPVFNFNSPDPGLGAIQARRPYPYYVDSRAPDQLLPISTIRLLSTDVNSNYNALQLRAEKRYAQGLTFAASFNYQKAMAVGYEINSGGGFGPQTTQDPRNRVPDWGRSLIDQRFRFVLSHVWQLPFMRSSTGFKRLLLAGWSINGIVTLASGLPVTVSETGDSQNTGNVGSAERPNIVAGQAVDRVMDGRTLQRWFNTSAFVRSKCDGCPGEGTFVGPKGYGNAGIALFDAPGSKTWDFGISKDFRVREGHRLQFRWEAFNALNTPQFTAPSASLGSATFGTISSTISNNREMQFGLKYIF